MILILAIPSIGLVFFSAREVLQQRAVVRQQMALADNGAVLDQIGDVVHELQRERGRSAMFLNSGGTKFAGELNDQRRATDDQLAKLHTLLVGFDAAQFGSDFVAKLNNALNSLGDLPARRSAITATQIKTPASTAYYTETISRAMEVVVAMSHLSPDAQVADGISCYVNFLQAKENAGIERATLVGVFASDKFTPESLSRFSQVAAAQDTYLHVFLTFATEEQRRFYETTVKGPAVESVEKMRAIARAKLTEGNFGIDPAAWFDLITQKIDLMKLVEDRLSADYALRSEQRREAARSQLLSLSLLAVAALVLTAALGALVIRSIVRPLRIVIDDLGAGAEHTAATAEQVASTSQSLAGGASEQASSLEETTASLEEMSGTTKRNAENAATAKSVAAQTRITADAGAADMQAMNQAMAEIKGSSDNIAKIIKSIDEIAFQTNILALNAAVEAARAGEAGMGFSVVAEEVRNLARRSADAARETASKIEDSIQKSNRGVQICGQVEQRLTEIVEHARRMNDLVAEIATASSEQSRGIEHINSGMMQMDRVTQANAASAEESASAAEELSRHAVAQREAVAQLIRIIDPSREVTGANLFARPQDIRRNENSGTRFSAKAKTARSESGLYPKASGFAGRPQDNGTPSQTLHFPNGANGHGNHGSRRAMQAA